MEEERKDQIIVFASSRPSTQFMGDESQEQRVPAYLKIEVLQTNVNQFLGKMDPIIGSCPEKIGGFALDTVEIHAEIDGNGQVGLLGTGVNIGATAGIKFVLSKKRKT
jgi:hypothetical protein